MSQSENTSLAELEGGNLDTIPHIRDLFLEITSQHPDVEAIVSLHQSPLRLPGLDYDDEQSCLRWTYRQLKQGASHLAGQLDAVGVRKGSAIVFFCENRAEWVLLCWTSIILGCPFVPLNPRLASNGEELRYVLDQIWPSVIVVAGETTRASLEANAREQLEKAGLLLSLQEVGVMVTQNGDRWMPLASFWSRTTVVRSEWAGPIFENTSIIGFTSGTTSRPKACPQSSDNLMTSAVAVRDLRGLGPTDRLCQHLPSFAAMAVLISLTCGTSGVTIVYPSPFFSATATLDAIENEHCTYTFAAPAIVKALAMHPTIAQRTLESLRIVELGGAPIYPDVFQLATSKPGLNCKRVGCGWGMTESPAPLLAEPWERTMPLPIEYIAVGKPIKGTYAKICLPGSRQPIKRGEEGELHVGGSQVVRGYLNGDNESFYEEGGIRWIKTGDMARIQDGQVYIIGRYKDIIIRGGQNISPAKIERTLEKISGVEAQVVGVPDNLAGEVPVAVVKLTRHQASSSDTIIRSLRDIAMRDLGPTETPYALVSLTKLGMDHFPTTLSGKIQKAVLAERVRGYFKNDISDGGIPQETNIEAILVELWSKVSGVPASSIDPLASVFSFADSITTMRLSTLVKQQLQKDLTVDDVVQHPSIHEQANLLDSRPASSGSGQQNQRPGPPNTDDIVHANGDPSQVVATERLATPLLKRLGLRWDDVEDVFPAPDTSFIYLNRKRPQTWNQRVIYFASSTGVENLTSAWKAVLVHHAMFRTVAVPTAARSLRDTKHLFVVLRPTEAFWKCSVTDGLEVNTPEDLRSIFKNVWADTLAGPLSRVAFIRIKSSASSAFILVGNHAAYDNLSMDLLLSDLETALSHNLTAENIMQAPGHVPYKKFADLYYHYRAMDDALEAAKFHASRLCGIGSLKDSLWPKARAPGWFKGADEGWTHNGGAPGNPASRTPIDSPENRHGLDGLTRTAPVHTLQAMKEKHSIMPHVILKVAVALFNMRRTNTTTALFANVEAGRRWPSTPDTNEETLPNPLGIAGPMFQVVLNRISLTEPDESVLSVLQRVQEEQKLLSEHSQAPLFLIHALLQDTDGDVFFDALARQGYNWAPGIQSSSRADTEKPPALVKFNRQALDDIGLAWTCGLRDRETFYVNASYDDCQLCNDAVYGYLGDVLSAGAWLADPNNIKKGVGECVFKNSNVSGLIKSLE
ncbi:acetyl-CoA synthetase-like protein [Lentithecium fluviatile CBS 122367]|uniref:Acetyl-CoA synthetase-like protein n=1 Tax=Lentithecium fluviatile CBS 122367 TaxID=1168545 RepID=A0A6G1JN49_9PLEO|nr:acetyl-CoA synthetase-like protein [Lentithecium fluviatile CBS 122367]